MDTEIRDLIYLLKGLVETTESCAGNFFGIHYFDLFNGDNVRELIKRGLEDFVRGDVVLIQGFCPYLGIIVENAEGFRILDGLMRKYNPRIIQTEKDGKEVRGYFFLFEEWNGIAKKIEEIVRRSGINKEAIEIVYKMVKNYLSEAYLLIRAIFVDIFYHFYSKAFIIGQLSRGCQDYRIFGQKDLYLQLL